MRPELLDPLFAIIPLVPVFIGIATAVIISILVPLSVGAARGWPAIGATGGVCAGATAFFFGLLGGLPVGGVFCILILALGDPDRPRRHRHEFDEDDDANDDHERRPRRHRKTRRQRGSGGRTTAIVGGSIAGTLSSAVIVFFLVDHFRNPGNRAEPVNPFGAAKPQPANPLGTDKPQPEKVSVPDERLTPVDPPFATDPLLERAARPVFLADMTEFGVKLGPWKLGKGELGDGARTPIRVDRIDFPRGLSVHPYDRGTTRVCYALGGRAATLAGSVGLNDYTNKGSSVVFALLGDGKDLWRTAPVNRGSRADFRVDVRGVNVLELRATAQGFHFGAHAVWLDPVIEK